MPNKDGTGPLEQGAQTGRGLGACEGGMRRGFGRNFCGGQGLRYNKHIALTQADEKKILEAELKEIEAQRQAIEKKLEEMK